MHIFPEQWRALEDCLPRSAVKVLTKKEEEQDLDGMNQTSELRSLITSLYYECLRGGGGGSEAASEGEEYEDSEIVTINQSSILFCPRTFDGYLCWPKTRAGQRISLQCPGFVTGFDPTRVAYKT